MNNFIVGEGGEDSMEYEGRNTLLSSVCNNLNSSTSKLFEEFKVRSMYNPLMSPLTPPLFPEAIHPDTSTGSERKQCAHPLMYGRCEQNGGKAGEPVDDDIYDFREMQAQAQREISVGLYCPGNNNCSASIT